MNSNTLDLIASYLREKAPIRRAWLFGSHARGTQSPTSDIVMLGAPLKSITTQLNHDKILIYEKPSPKLERTNRLTLV